MSKRRGQKKINPAFIAQGGAQAGGFAIAPIIAGAMAAHAGLEKYKPFSRLNQALEDNVSNKDNIFYKIAHGITGVGKSLGYGPPPPPPKKRRKRKGKK